MRFEVTPQQDPQVDLLMKANAIKINHNLDETGDKNLIKGAFSSGAFSPAGTPNIKIPNANATATATATPTHVAGLSSSTPDSIIPSLSMANSGVATPMSASPAEKGEDDVKNFFYNNQKFRRPSHENHISEKVGEKLGPQYIQPKSRFNNSSPAVNSSVVHGKKTTDDPGLPALKINRSSSNLSGLSGSHTNLSALNHTVPRKRSSLSKPLPSFLLHDNNSSSSLAITEEENEEENDEDNSKKEIAWDDDSMNFNEVTLTNNENRLAPYGGFSGPLVEGSLFKKGNIFESAKWDVVFTAKGNVSLRKAVRLAVDSGIIKDRKWVGTIAMPSDDVSKKVIGDIATRLSEDYNSEAVFPNDITFDGHYHSFCKQILWPTLHYQIPDDPKSKAFEDHSWGYYKLLNQLVADKIVDVYKKENGNADPNDPNNMIWIHDYHLLLVPLMVREKLPNAKIGLFLHVSFPSSEVFRCLAQRQEILQGMLGANCISFQTDEYVRHFLQTCNRLLLADTNELGITYNGDFTLTNTIPVGIHCDSLNEVVHSDDVTEWRRLIRERWGSLNLIVSRDKLDKLRGIKQKLLAYEMFLKANPSFIDNTVLIQIGNSPRDSDYESEILQIVDRINSLSDNMVSQPVVLLQKDIEFEQYLALQCEADTFVVSSMREGLNLTCHEFITATSEKKSPLILSEFTGSSHLLDVDGHGAILINPWAITQFSKTFLQALTMDPKEKLERWKNCYKIVYDQDSTNWIKSCILSISEGWDRNKRRNLNTLISFNQSEYDKFLQHSSKGKRLYFLNFDSPKSSAPTTETKQTFEGAKNYIEPSLLGNLLSDFPENEQNMVYLMSFLKKAELDRLYGRYPALGLIAENGGYIKLIGSTEWISIVDNTELRWMPQVIKLIQSKVERLPGSFCEVEDCTVRFHAGKSMTDNRERSLDAMGECIQHVNVLFQKSDGVHATLIRNVVVVQNDHLALKALKFITEFYGLKDNETLIEEYKMKHSSSFKAEAFELATTNDNSDVSGILVGGGSTAVDEPVYEFVSNLKHQNAVDAILTVAILGGDTEVRTAATHYVNGKNELLRLLTSPAK